MTADSPGAGPAPTSSDQTLVDPRVRQAALARRVRRFDKVLSDRMALTRLELPLGVARMNPDLARVYYLNAVEVTRPAAIVEVLDTVQQIFHRAGLDHRTVTTVLPEVAWTLHPALTDRGWIGARLTYMVHDRDSPSPVSPVGFRSVDIDQWSQIADAFVADNEWGRTPQVQTDMAGRDQRIAERVDTTFVVSADGMAGCHVYRAGGVAQIENVHVLTEARGRGLGHGLMAAALQTCQDAELVFLIADAEDWPLDWYCRMGFRAVAPGWEWMRLPG